MTTQTHITDAEFSRSINLWGRLTVGLGLILSIAAPVYLFVFEGLFPGWNVLIACFFAVAVIFGVNWLVEPATYFPMLGVAGTYQAWLVGNISNKLLPAAVTAQGATDTKPGTKKAELISVAAMSGAVVVHLVGMILLVGALGQVIVNALPESVIKTFDYILPAIFGAVSIQLAVVLKNWIVAGVALLAGIVAVFFLTPVLGSWSALAMPFVVIITVAAALITGRIQDTGEPEEEGGTITADGIM